MTANRQNSTRTKARKHALDILFEADLRGADPRETLADQIAAGERSVRPFTIQLVQGVTDHGEQLDAALRAALGEQWSLERMPIVDRTLARLAVFELAHTDTPLAVVANEAVDLAAEYSGQNSPAFLNALLDRAARVLVEPAASSEETRPTEPAAPSEESDDQPVGDDPAP